MIRHFGWCWSLRRTWKTDFFFFSASLISQVWKWKNKYLMRPFLDSALKISWLSRAFMSNFSIFYSFFFRENWSLTADKSYRIVPLFVFDGVSFHIGVIEKCFELENVFLAWWIASSRFVFILAFTLRKKWSTYGKLFYLPSWPRNKLCSSKKKVKPGQTKPKNIENEIQYSRAFITAEKLEVPTMIDCVLSQKLETKYNVI